MSDIRSDIPLAEATGPEGEHYVLLEVDLPHELYARQYEWFRVMPDDELAATGRRTTTIAGAFLRMPASWDCCF